HRHRHAHNTFNGFVFPDQLHKAAHGVGAGGNGLQVRGQTAVRIANRHSDTHISDVDPDTTSRSHRPNLIGPTSSIQPHRPSSSALLRCHRLDSRLVRISSKAASARATSPPPP